MILMVLGSGIVSFPAIIRRLVVCLCACVALVMAGGKLCTAQKSPAKPRPVYLRRDRANLFLGKSPFRNIGVNLPTLFTDSLNNDTKQVEDILLRAKNAGVRFVRCPVILGTAQSIQMLQSQSETWHAAFARMLALADAQGIAVVPTLLPRYSTLDSVLMSPAPSDRNPNTILQQGGAFNSRIVALVRAVVSRYQNDPRILFWEIADGFNLGADADSNPTTEQTARFLQQIAQEIKQIDRNHLVSTGNADLLPNAFHKRDKSAGLDSFNEYAVMIAALTPEPMDFVTVQQFLPGPDSPQWLIEINDAALILPWTRRAADNINRPLFVALFGSRNPFHANLVSQKWLADFRKRVEAGVASLACIAQDDFLADDTVGALAAANAEILREVTIDAQYRR